jgi:hypothetical protein
VTESRSRAPARTARSTSNASRRHQTNIDLDEFASRVKDFRVELLQIDQGMFRADGVQASLGGVLLGTARLGRALVQTWTSPVQSITIAVRTSLAPSR